MKRWVFWGFAAIFLYLGYVAVTISLLPPVSDLKNKKITNIIQVKDWHGDFHPLAVGPKNRYWAPLSSIPPEMKWAVVLAEDSNFYKHEGVDVKALKNAIKYDLENKKLARGASTITQQTAKNLFLSREKTITRKLKELYLALRMEQELTKGRIMELYLNMVELGPMVYGIGHGSRYYFGKTPSMLSAREASFLAAMLPGPRIAYNPYRNLGKVLKRSDMILGLLRKKGVLSEDEYRSALAEIPNIAGMTRKVEKAVTEPLPPVQQQISSAVSEKVDAALPKVEEKPASDSAEKPPEPAPVKDQKE